MITSLMDFGCNGLSCGILCRIHNAFAEIEWVTQFFFIGLFIAVRGLEQVGRLTSWRNGCCQLTKGDMAVPAYTILWGSVIASAFVDNILFVATMIPLMLLTVAIALVYICLR